MEWALYDPEHGYYVRGPDRLGEAGDFFTASDVGSLFGECLARQLVEMDSLLGAPDPFFYVEFGPGRGLLASDVVGHLRAAGEGLAGRLRIVLVDSSPAMRAECRRRVPEAEVRSDAPPPGEREGCAVAVEWFDALPVHRVRRRGTDLVEILVGLDGSGALVEMEGQPSADVRGWADRFGAAPSDGDEAEVPLAMSPALEAMAETLSRGFHLVVDYGYPGGEMYSPRHRRGTVMAYYRHRASEDVLDRPGEQDLTAHVNFTALDALAVQSGLLPLGLTTQDRFLIANGILEVFGTESPELWSAPARVKRRLQARQLIHPDSMGRTFRVWAGAKGFSHAPLLRGLADPFDSCAGVERR